MNLAVIPARGGSKRIPRKNVREFCGKPIIAYSIDAAQSSGLFDRIIVSTDCAQIAETAREFGADVPFRRPADLADDYTGTNAVVRHAIDWMQKRGESVSMVCCIYATAPFIRAEFLKRGYDKLIASNNNFAFSVTSFAFPIQRALRLTGDGGVEPMWPEHTLSRSQDLVEAWHDAGQFYWGTAQAYLDDCPVFARSSIPVLVPRHLVQDIDTEEDWRRAELMFEALARL